MTIAISGSLAFDRIMTFPERFADHILPDKLHILNVCFLVDSMEERFGGTAGNIAYNLCLLGEKPVIHGVLGKDGQRYMDRLKELGLPLDMIRTIEDEHTAGAFITTDKADNQITGFNPGAMRRRMERDPKTGPDDLGIISPGNADDMVGHAEVFRDRGTPFVFDPGQQIPALGGEGLSRGMEGAAVFIANDYELEMTMQATGLDMDGMLGKCRSVVTTLGDQGCRVHTAGADPVEVPALPVLDAQDPTGAGDAFRAGLLKGLAEGRPLEEACGLGAAVAAYCVERRGTQEHVFTPEDILERARGAYGPPAWAGALGAMVA
ncbi:carbohydrate kinase family protein [Desulfohalovibrio reitneri]|uniref:carbohydrate kinase family protein n=1 Tax=Desulfohalovibrio reitneri TaxID=1307759 RepID=UPI0006915805|nr:carbohydrate kinase family protein [Desulfohalovibrio reitneri]